MSRLLTLLLVLALFPAGAPRADESLPAGEADSGRAAWCSRTSASVRAALYDPNHRLSFKNPSGRFRTGLCWWHSRYTRSSAYIARFLPDQPKLPRKEMIRRIHRLAYMDGVTEFPGYANLWEMSKDWKPEITDALNDWQLRDALTRNSITRGWAGRPTPKPDLLQRFMDEMFERVEVEGHVGFHKLKLRKLEYGSHAWLVLAMERFPGGYILDILDSNSTGVHKILYLDGDGVIGWRQPDGVEDKYGAWAMKAYGETFPFEQDTTDYGHFARALEKYCGADYVPPGAVRIKRPEQPE